MSDQDIAITGAFKVPDGSPVSTKPCYLVVLSEKTGIGKNQQFKKFIALELPDMQASFIKIKGFFCDANEETIVVDFRKIIQALDKDTMQELYLPWHAVSYVRSLVFKAK